MPGFGAGGTTLSYTTGSSYKTNGAPDGQTMPGVGGLPQETVNHQYNQITGLPKGLTTTQAQSVYLNNTLYMFDGLVYERYLGVTGSRVRIQTNHGAPGRRLSSIYLNTETPGTQDDYGNSKLANDQYLYDPAGNITSIRSTANAVADQQECFRYDDHLRRLTEAWSQTPATCTTPQRTGPDAYWRQWVFDNLGNRHTETDKDPTAGDTTWTHTVGSPAGFKPHQVSSVTGSGPLAGAARSFEYHPDGTTKTRTTPQGTAQTLTWDKEGHLATLTGGGTTTTTYTYDTNGNRLIASNPSKKTLYLPDGTELEKTGTDDPLGTRHYAGIAVRDATGLRWIYADRNGTSMAQIDPATLVIHRQRSMPYGQPRGTQATSWKGTKGYVGGTKDDTGLTHLGAREYDPTLGRFISVDPIMDLTDPQQWNAYTYSAASPITRSDPSGLVPCDECMPGSGGQSAGPKSGCFSANACEGRPPNCSAGTTCAKISNTTQTPAGADLFKDRFKPCDKAPSHCSGFHNALEESLYYLLDDIVAAATEAGVDPRLLLAVLIRESGDAHGSSWMDNSPLGWFHDFSIGIANMQLPAFEEAKAYSNGAIDYDVDATAEDPVKSMRAAAYLLAKLVASIPANANTVYTKQELARFGYNFGAGTMMQIAQSGRAVRGSDFIVEQDLFREAFSTADHWVCQAGYYVCGG